MISVCGVIYSWVWANPLKPHWPTRTDFCRRERKCSLGIWPLVCQMALPLPQAINCQYLPSQELEHMNLSLHYMVVCWLAWSCAVLEKANDSCCEFWEQWAFHTQKIVFCSVCPQTLDFTVFMAQISTIVIEPCLEGWESYLGHLWEVKTLRRNYTEKLWFYQNMQVL